jgi:hypothetical protein
VRWVDADCTAKLKALIRSHVIARPPGNTRSIRIPGSCELGPINTRRMTKCFFILVMLPTIRECVTQEQKLFTVICPEWRTLARLGIGKIIQI